MRYTAVEEPDGSGAVGVRHTVNHQPSTINHQLARPFPWTIAIAATALLLIGLSGIERADQWAEGLDLFPRQITWVMIGVPLVVISASIPYRRWQPLSYGLLLAVIPLLVVVFWMPARNGARCWIPLGFFDLQPSELAKLAFILTLADYLSLRDNYRQWLGLVPPFLVTLIPAGLILKEPDLGSAMLFFPILFAMLFAAGARPRHLALILFAGCLSLPLFWWGMNPEQQSRITSCSRRSMAVRLPRAMAITCTSPSWSWCWEGRWGVKSPGIDSKIPMPTICLPARRISCTPGSANAGG